MNALRLHRMAGALALRGVPLVPGLLRAASTLLHRGSVAPSAEVGEGAALGYGGLGVVIGDGVRVGRDCHIAHGVTLAPLSHAGPAPELGARVFVGAGAQVLGGVRVGDDAIIGANAVVLGDVAPGAVVAGVPASPVHAGRRRRTRG